MKQGIPVVYDGVLPPGHVGAADQSRQTSSWVRIRTAPPAAVLELLPSGWVLPTRPSPWPPARAGFRVPQTIRVTISGDLPKGCYSKDVVLVVAKEMGPDGANYRVIEYAGSTVEGFNVPARLTLTNMSAEMGAKAAVVAPDDQTRAYLEENDRLVDFEPLRSDPGASFERELRFDVSDLKPMIACPPDIDNDVPVEQVECEKVFGRSGLYRILHQLPH